MLPLVSSSDEALEQRMGLVRFAQELRMKLRGDVERMRRQLDNFHEGIVRSRAAENKAGGLVSCTIGVVEFVAVPMPFADEKKPRKASLPVSLP